MSDSLLLSEVERRKVDYYLLKNLQINPCLCSFLPAHPPTEPVWNCRGLSSCTDEAHHQQCWQSKCADHTVLLPLTNTHNRRTFLCTELNADKQADRADTLPPAICVGSSSYWHEQREAVFHPAAAVAAAGRSGGGSIQHQSKHSRLNYCR